MTIALPLPYRDETLYSVIGRYLEAVGVSAPTYVINTLFGRIGHPKKEMVCCLAEFCRQTRPSWGLSALEVAKSFTVVPYYAAHTTLERRAIAYNAIVGEGNVSPAVVLGVNRSKVALVRGLRFCRRCVMEDVAGGRRPCWKRSHQLPGVFVCLEHGAPLFVCDLGKYERQKNISYLAEDTSAWSENADVRATGEGALAALTADNASEQISSADTDWYAFAKQRGFVLTSGYVDTTSIRAGLYEMYGNAYLDVTGLGMSAHEPAPWAARLIQRRNVSFQPIQYILLGHFLQRCEGPNLRSSVILRDIVKHRIVCPNRYAKHETGHFVDHIRLTDSATGRCVGHAHCHCGVYFLFDGYEPDGYAPTSITITRYGNDWCDAVRAMRLKGLSFPAIERSMGLPRRAARRMLTESDKRPTRPPTRAVIRRWRHEWRELLRAVAPEGHLAAARLNKYLYSQLLEFDIQWVTQSANRYRHRRSRDIEVERTERDADWALRLQRAAEKILASGPPLTRASKTAIATEAGLWVLTDAAKHKLPLCHRTLAELAESAERFQVRRLEAATREMIALGDSVTRWKLLLRAGISKVKSPVVEATVLALTSGTFHSETAKDPLGGIS